MGHFFDVIHTLGFELSLSIITICYMVFFPLLRILVNEGEYSPTVLYLVLYMYQAISAVGCAAYSLENLKMDEAIQRHRQPNGEVKWNPIIFFYSISFFIGLHNIPISKIIRDVNNPCHKTISCFVIVFIPLTFAIVSIVFLTPAIDQHLNILFWLPWLLYLYLYAYMTVYGILAIFNNKYHLVYFHPFTYLLYVFHLPFLCWISRVVQNKKVDLNESVNTNDSIEGYDIEGFAEVKPKMDENIFEIYERLTVHDQLTRTKSFRKTLVLKPLTQRTKEILPDDVPSVESEISRISEESKVELCPVCKESLDKSQHQVMSAWGHGYHFKCLMSEMKSTRKCPTCGEKLRPK